MCDLDLYFGYPWGKRFYEFFTPNEATLEKELFSLARTDGQTAGSGPKIYKNVKMRPIVG